MKYFEHQGKKVAYEDLGDGPPVVLVHCSGASHREWNSLVSVLQKNHRVLAPDLLGYGDSDRWPDEEPFDPYTDVNTILNLLERIDGPVHLVGHSYGGALCLDVARQLGSKIKSLTLIEPVAFYLLRLSNAEKDWNTIQKQAKEIINAVENDDPARAASVFMRYWIGPFRWWFMPRKMKEVVIGSMVKVAREFTIIHKVDIPLSEYKKIDTPTRLILGTRTTSPAKTLVSIISDLLPNTELCVVKGAGHMSPFTHKEKINSLINEFIQPYLSDYQG